MTKRVILAYSGGLDTSVAIRWMIEEWGVEVVCVLVDVGQDAESAESFDDIRARAMVAGAIDCVLVDARTEAIAGGKSLTVRLRSRKLPLEVATVYRMYDGHPALRKHLRLRNTGGSPLLLTHLNVETLELAIGPENEMTLLTQYGTVPREIFYTGRSEDAGLLVKNATTGDGMAIVSEVPGYMKRTEIGG